MLVYFFFLDLVQENIFEWHFTVRGPRDTEFEGGIYHGKILLPLEYPFKPPDIIFLTVSSLSLSLSPCSSRMIFVS
jgi:ubiquitin-protein ligase